MGACTEPDKCKHLGNAPGIGEYCKKSKYILDGPEPDYCDRKNPDETAIPQPIKETMQDKLKKYQIYMFPNGNHRMVLKENIVKCPTCGHDMLDE